jgi:hypothetical protein
LGQTSRPLAAVALSYAILAAVGIGAAIARPQPLLRHDAAVHTMEEATSAPMPVDARAVPLAAPIHPAPQPPPPTTTAPPAAPPPPAPPPLALPVGKSMFIYEPERTEGGNVEGIVSRARAVGLEDLWVRTGSSWDGFNGAGFVKALLPAAHKAGLRVYGWDFPKLADVNGDVARAVAAIRLRANDGTGLDGFAADIETPSEGTQLTATGTAAYGDLLRRAVGDAYPLIAIVPRPSPERAGYPYAQVVARFNVIAPMVYWLNRDPASDVAGALRDLKGFGKPVVPIGQAYDGAAEGGRRGVPPPAELQAFMDVAARNGAAGVSFWVWQTANAAVWDTIRTSPLFAPGTIVGAAAGALSPV